PAVRPAVRPAGPGAGGPTRRLVSVAAEPRAGRVAAALPDAGHAGRPRGQPGPAGRRHQDPGLRPARARPDHDSPAAAGRVQRSEDPPGGGQWPTTDMTVTARPLTRR